MTTMELNTELFRQLSLIADDQDSMRKVVNYLKRLTAAKAKTSMKEDTEYISKEEVIEGIRQGLLDMKEAQQTGKQQKTLQEYIDEL